MTDGSGEVDEYILPLNRERHFCKAIQDDLRARVEMLPEMLGIAARRKLPQPFVEDRLEYQGGGGRAVARVFLKLP
jgi:hypothetical protein